MDIKLEASPEEVEALMQLLDAAVRHSGLSLANPAAIWLQKIHKAQEKSKEKMKK